MTGSHVRVLPAVRDPAFFRPARRAVNSTVLPPPEPRQAAVAQGRRPVVTSLKTLQKAR
jgi:hypothetical protein